MARTLIGIEQWNGRVVKGTGRLRARDRKMRRPRFSGPSEAMSCGPCNFMHHTFMHKVTKKTCPGTINPMRSTIAIDPFHATVTRSRQRPFWQMMMNGPPQRISAGASWYELLRTESIACEESASNGGRSIRTTHILCREMVPSSYIQWALR